MKKPVVWPAILVSILLVFSACDNQKFKPDEGFFTPRAVVPDSLKPIFENLDQSIDEWRKEGKMVGAEALIIKDRDILFHRAYGWADREDEIPMTRNTVFRIRSMTKPVVGTSILMLYQRGRLDLKDRVSKYIAAFDNEKSDSITIYQLLTHTGGFTQPGFPEGSVYDYSSLKEAVRDLGEHGPEHEPGEKFIYSDAGSSTLALLVEKVSGIPCEEFIEKNIFKPLAMDNSYCLAPANDTLRKGFSSTYQWSGDHFEKYWDNSDDQEIGFFRGSGGIFCTPIDYARFLYSWSNSGRGLITEKIRKRALRPAGMNESYGLQWEIYHSSGEETVAFGHGGSDGTIAISIPSMNILAIFFTQSRGTITVARFEKMILESLGVTEPVEYDAVELDREAVLEITGKYGDSGLSAKIFSKDGSLYIQLNQSPYIGIITLSEEEAVIEDLDIKVKFNRDRNGRVNSMKIIMDGNVFDLEKTDSPG